MGEGYKNGDKYAVRPETVSVFVSPFAVESTTIYFF
jgi:hypothetical protein